MSHLFRLFYSIHQENIHPLNTSKFPFLHYFKCISHYINQLVFNKDYEQGYKKIGAYTFHSSGQYKLAVNSYYFLLCY